MYLITLEVDHKITCNYVETNHCACTWGKGDNLSSFPRYFTLFGQIMMLDKKLFIVHFRSMTNNMRWFSEDFSVVLEMSINHIFAITLIHSHNA
jgi:hypothetical protein